jgi:hypothetical protein
MFFLCRTFVFLQFDVCNLTPPVLRDYTKRPFTKSVKESILATKSFSGKTI